MMPGTTIPPKPLQPFYSAEEVWATPDVGDHAFINPRDFDGVEIDGQTCRLVLIRVDGKLQLRAEPH